MTQHLKTLLDLGKDDLLELLATAEKLRAKREHQVAGPLAGKSVALIFEKPSTRTRLSFEVGVYELGGQPLSLLGRDTQLGRGELAESLEDTAKMLSRFVHAAVYRTAEHERVEILAENSTIPVINGLTDRFHPCQLLADLLTIKMEFGDLEDLTVAWVGDGNNMANSWIHAACLSGLKLRLACPDRYLPNPNVLRYAETTAPGQIELVLHPEDAIRGAHVVTSDVWTSMGQEEENKLRRQVFADYQVDTKRMKLAQPEAVFLHCLPAHRGEEVAADVIDGPQSRVLDEAENRLHVQKALLVHLLQTKNPSQTRN